MLTEWFIITYVYVGNMCQFRTRTVHLYCAKNRRNVLQIIKKSEVETLTIKENEWLKFPAVKMYYYIKTKTILFYTQDSRKYHFDDCLNITHRMLNSRIISKVHQFVN